MLANVDVERTEQNVKPECGIFIIMVNCCWFSGVTTHGRRPRIKSQISVICVIETIFAEILCVRERESDIIGHF